MLTVIGGYKSEAEGHEGHAETSIGQNVDFLTWERSNLSSNSSLTVLNSIRLHLYFKIIGSICLRAYGLFFRPNFWSIVINQSILFHVLLLATCQIFNLQKNSSNHTPVLSVKKYKREYVRLFPTTQKSHRFRLLSQNRYLGKINSKINHNKFKRYYIQSNYYYIALKIYF